MRPLRLVLAAIGRHPPECTPETQSGAHGRLIGGLGMTGDAIVCVRCGRERYAESWNASEVARSEPVCKGLRSLVDAARGLPEGLSTRAPDGDPDAEHLVRAGRRPPWMLGRHRRPARPPS